MKRLAAAILVAALLVPATTFGQVLLREDNIEEVIEAMTLKEKASLVVGAGYGSMLSGVFKTNYPCPGAAGMTRSIERLGIPGIVLSDGPAGVRIEHTRKGAENKGKTFYCTGFPVGTLLACSWNEELVEEVGASIGAEAYAYGVDVLLAPGMNLHRNPLCGRNFEYFSEDPLLTGKIAAAYVRGVQSEGVGTSVKHFAANNQETNRFMSDSQVDEEVLRELYLKGFEIAIKEAQPWTVMASYNMINGIHTQCDPFLLTQVLREEWGFEGLVMTDWTGKRDTQAQIEAGDDLMEPGAKSQINDLVRRIKKGEMDVKSLDVSVRRVLELVVKTPTFKGVERTGTPDLNAHASVARRAAEEGIVLLKNNDALPLAAGLRVALFGTTSYSLLAGGTGSGHVQRPYVIDVEDGLRNNGYGIDEGLAEVYHKYLKKNEPRQTVGRRLLGAPAAPEMKLERALVEAHVEGNDIAVYTLARQAGEGGDRHLEDDFLLSNDEQAIIEDICSVFHAAGKKVVVVLNIGGVIETVSWKDKPDAILLAWQPGQEGGNAVADILSGAVNPSGKLSMTFPIDYFDIPSSANFPYDFHGIGSMGEIKRSSLKHIRNVDYTIYEEGMNVGYRHFGISGEGVSYPFGYGLSYTTFAVSEPVFVDGSAKVTVTNTGNRPGKEVVTIHNPHLTAFAKTKLLQPGESQTLWLK